MKGKLGILRHGVVWVVAIAPALLLYIAMVLSAALPARHRAAA